MLRLQLQSLNPLLMRGKLADGPTPGQPAGFFTSTNCSCTSIHLNPAGTPGPGPALGPVPGLNPDHDPGSVPGFNPGPGSGPRAHLLRLCGFSEMLSAWLVLCVFLLKV